MKLRMIAGGDCAASTCPTAYLTDRGTAVVQGYVITDPEALAELELPAGENAVEVPVELLVSAAGKAAASA